MSLSRRELANAIRFLSIDAVQAADSGHPGMPMGMADIAEVLWRDFLKHNPRDPKWDNRDRFVLSNGHGSMLLYALLHLTGYALPIEQLQRFRQLHSHTPGHPEFGETVGVETTTGPLGQGLANAVGMAIAERRLAAEFNRPDFAIVDHHTYAFVGDGCLMEGISHEAASLAGTLSLGKLIVFWDDNGISIDGPIAGWCRDDVAVRFESYNWHVVPSVDGHDPKAIRGAIQKALCVRDKPSLICCKTLIGFGSPKFAGDEKSHGAPLGKEEIAAVRTALNWPHAPFVIPDELKLVWDASEAGVRRQDAWAENFDAYQAAYPDLAREYLRRQAQHLPGDFSRAMEMFIAYCQEQQVSVATRKASLMCLEEMHQHLPELIGGSADLSGSNCTKVKAANSFTSEEAGNYIHYGVREFGMNAVMNGIQLHGGLIPFGGTFLTFSDYGRNAIRMAALMKQGTIFVFTHDSIGLGEDGPTHQPIEHIASLRLIPGVSVWRPADLTETAVAWQQAILQRNKPTCLLLSRQNLPLQVRTSAQLRDIEKGGYRLYQSANPVVILIATGSEVTLAMQAKDQLLQEGVEVDVVSMPSLDAFTRQPKAYQESILPPQIKKRIAIEAGVPDSWYRYVGAEGVVMGVERFGLSAPAEQVYENLGLTVACIVSQVELLLSKSV